MEVRILKYTGPLENGTVVVRQESPLSKFRNIRVYPGAQWEVGKDIPEKTAKHITDMMGHSFKVEVLQLDNNGEILHNIKDFLKGFKDRLAKDADAVLPALTIEAILDIFGDGALVSIQSCLENSAKISPEAREKFGINAKVEAEVEVEKAKPVEKTGAGDDESKADEDGAGEAEDGGAETDGTGDEATEETGPKAKASPKRSPAKPKAAPKRK